MPNFHALTGGQTEDINALQLMEQRVQQLEALVSEMQVELQELRVHADPHAQKRLHKMLRYQQALDGMFGLSEPA